MAEINKNSILYRPKLDYEKSYKTTGTISTNTNNYNIDSDSTRDNPVDNLKDRLADIKDSVSILPKEIKDLIAPQLIGVGVLINTIDPETIPDNMPVPSKTTIDVISIDPNLDPDDPFANTIIDIPDVTVNTTDPAKYIEQQYYYDMASIINDYLDKINQIIKTWVSANTQILMNIGFDKIDEINKVYNQSITDLNNIDLAHLSDIIHKSQIMRDQKMRLYKKLYDVDSMVMNIRMCLIAYQYRMRYVVEKFTNTEDLVDMFSNDLLSASNTSSENKYKDSFKNLYKYLNSSVISISECLNMLTTESYAKANLIKKGI